MEQNNYTKLATDDGLAGKIDNLATAVGDLATTVDDLARMTKKGFDEMNDKFEKIDERFEKVDERFEMTDQKIMKESQATRDYVSKEVARATAEAMMRDRTLDDKGDTTVDTLEHKQVLSSEEAAVIKNISPFPAVSVSAR